VSAGRLADLRAGPVWEPLVKPVLQIAAQAAPMPADADQRDRKIAKSFHDTREVFDRPQRNTGVDAAGFDAAHGSFTGW
jgi:hypothetical protein